MARLNERSAMSYKQRKMWMREIENNFIDNTYMVELYEGFWNINVFKGLINVQLDAI